jgi:hypothetical protein
VFPVRFMALLYEVLVKHTKKKDTMDFHNFARLDSKASR